MTSLEMRTETTYYVDYSTFETFVQQIYGIADYSVVVAEECGNDSALSFYVDGKLNESDREDFENDVLEGQWQYATQLILDKLAEDGHIPTGNYVIEVSW